MDRGSMQMVLMPYDLFSWMKVKIMIRIKRMPAITFIKIQLDQMAAHSVHVNPPPSRPIWLFLLLLFYVFPAFAGHRLLIFSPFRQPGPALTPFSHTDPISPRCQATACFHVRHTNKWLFFPRIFDLWIYHRCIFRGMKKTTLTLDE